MKSASRLAALCLASSAHAQDAAQAIAAFAKCQVCHVATKGAKSTIGPNLFGVIGRKAGSEPAFVYSPAMKAAGFIWSPSRLDAYLAEPAKVVPGNRMPFFGIAEAQTRLKIVAYLETLH